MDKLKPIIEQKFWIFLGLALLLPFVGWYFAASHYAEGVEKREGEIEEAFGKMEFSAPVPNQKWIDGTQQIVQTEQQRLEAAQQKLWKLQQEGMKWPNFVESFMEDVPYEGKIDPTAREYYSQGYFDQLKEIEQRLQPFDYTTGEGLLLFDPNTYTHVDYGKWDRQAPTSQEMWNAQIDTWLVQAVFDSIISMNQGSKKITEAPIRKLIQLTLRGGVRDYSEGTIEAGGEGYGESTDGMFEEMDFSGTGEYGGGGGAGRNFNAQVSFDLSEELGPASGAGFGGGGEYGESLESFGDEGGGEGYGDGGYGETGGANTAAAGSDRYVDDDEGYPFRTRAFVLGVVMDHTELPEFMAELSRSDWPVQIIRVQMRAINLDELPPANRSGTGGSYGAPSSASGYGPSASGYGPSLYGGDGGGEGYGTADYDPGAFTGGEAYSDSGSGYSGIMPGIPGSSVPGAGPGARNAVGLAKQAMSDPYLAEVWIGGLITLFRPVENPSDERSQSPGVTEGTAPPVDPTGSDPNAAQQTTPPAAGQEPTAPAPADGTTTPGAEAPGTDGTSSPSPPPDDGTEQSPQTPPAAESSTGTEN